MKHLRWNCQGHASFKEGCEDCEQLTREMQPGFCYFGMGRKESPHQPDTNGRCKCGHLEVANG